MREQKARIVQTVLPPAREIQEASKHLHVNRLLICDESMNGETCVSIPYFCRESRKLFHLFSRKFDCINNMLITSTAAEIAGQRVPDLIFGWVWILFQERYQRHQDAWRTVAALQAVCLPK